MENLRDYVPGFREPRNLDLLTSGQHLMTVEKMEIQSDRIDTPEAAARDWTDENDVLYLFLTCAIGVYHLRLYWNGYHKFDDIIKDPKYADIIQHIRRPSSDRVRAYAVDKRTNSRIKSDYNTKIARQLIDEFCTACDPEGKNPVKLDELIGKKVWIELVPEWAFGRQMTKLLRVAPEKIGFKTGPRNNNPGNVAQPASIPISPTEGAF